LESANQLFSEQRYTEAERAFRNLIAQQVDAPTTAKATFNLGLMLQKVGRYDEAITTFKGTCLISRLATLNPGAI
jgi:TolA-binding protein